MHVTTRVKHNIIVFWQERQLPDFAEFKGNLTYLYYIFLYYSYIYYY